MQGRVRSMKGFARPSSALRGLPRQFSTLGVRRLKGSARSTFVDITGAGQAISPEMSVKAFTADAAFRVKLERLSGTATIERTGRLSARFHTDLAVDASDTSVFRWTVTDRRGPMTFDQAFASHCTDDKPKLTLTPNPATQTIHTSVGFAIATVEVICNDGHAPFDITWSVGLSPHSDRTFVPVNVDPGETVELDCIVDVIDAIGTHRTTTCHLIVIHD